MNFFEKQKALAEKCKDHMPMRLPDSALARLPQTEYIVFCVNNMAKVCELLEKALRALEYDDYEEHSPQDVSEEIQAELEKLANGN